MALFGFLFVGCSGASSGVLSAAQIGDILYWHNKARSEIAAAGYCGNMLEMSWDTTLAQAAQMNVCPTSHNGQAGNNYNTLKGTSGVWVGENLAWASNTCSTGLCADAGFCTGSQCETDCDTYCTLKAAVYNGWYHSETTDPTSNTAMCLPYNQEGGHCSQVNWQNSEFLGCGYFSNCPTTQGSVYSTTVNCNYIPGGNFNIPSTAVAYIGACKTGAACSSCPTGYNYCNNGLCSKNAPGTTGAPSTKAPTRTTTSAPTRAPHTRAPTTHGSTAAPSQGSGGSGSGTTTAPSTAGTTMAPVTMAPTSSPTQPRQIGYEYTLNICATPTHLPTAFNITCLLSGLEQIVSTVTPPGWLLAQQNGAEDFQQGVTTSTGCGWVSVVLPKVMIPLPILADSQFPISLVMDLQSSAYGNLVGANCAVPTNATIQASVILVEDCGTFWEAPSLNCAPPVLHSAAPITTGFIALIATLASLLLLH